MYHLRFFLITQKSINSFIIKPGSKNFKIVFRIVLLVAAIALVFYLARFARESEIVREIIATYGYAGIFLVSLVGGFNFIVPIPAVLLIPLFSEAGLMLWPSIFLIVVGVTIADSIAYYFGRIGRQVLAYSADGKILTRLERIRFHHPLWPVAFLFLFVSLVPYPNEILLVPMGFLGYRFSRLLPVILTGNFIFNVLYAFGFSNLFGIL